MIACLHDCIKYVMSRLAKSASDELFCTTYDKRSFLLYLIFATYVGDLSKSKDQLSVNRVDQTILRCRTCKISRENLADFRMPPKRSRSNIKSVFEGSQNLAERRQE